MINILLRYKYLEFAARYDTRHDRHKENQEIIKVREWDPHIGPLTRVIHFNLFLDMVPSSSANFTCAIFPRCVFSWRRVMADRASSKRKFEVSNAPSNKRKKTSPNLFCSKERTCTLCEFTHFFLLKLESFHFDFACEFYNSYNAVPQCNRTFFW